MCEYPDLSNPPFCKNVLTSRAFELSRGQSQLLSLQHQLGGTGRLGNIPIAVLAGMSAKGANMMPQSQDYSATNLLNVNNQQSMMM